jgi:hypothetical protein
MTNPHIAKSEAFVFALQQLERLDEAVGNPHEQNELDRHMTTSEDTDSIQVNEVKQFARTHDIDVDALLKEFRGTWNMWKWEH